MDARKAIKKVAEKYHKSEQEVRKEMQCFIEFATKSPDPAVRAKWAAIPKKGEVLTVEEVIEYAAMQIRTKNTRYS